MAETWYAPNQITYTRDQVIWLIDYLELLESGGYPPECRESGYSGQQGAVGHHAHFEMAAMIYSDLTSRLKKTGKDGERLVLLVQRDWPLDYDAKSALRYVCGYTTKPYSYEDWCWLDRKFQARRQEKRFYRLKMEQNTPDINKIPVAS